MDTPVQPVVQTKKQRSPEEQLLINERMEKVRRAKAQRKAERQEGQYVPYSVPPQPYNSHGAPLQVDNPVLGIGSGGDQQHDRMGSKLVAYANGDIPLDDELVQHMLEQADVPPLPGQAMDVDDNDEIPGLGRDNGPYIPVRQAVQAPRPIKPLRAVDSIGDRPSHRPPQVNKSSFGARILGRHNMWSVAEHLARAGAAGFALYLIYTQLRSLRSGEDPEAGVIPVFNEATRHAVGPAPRTSEPEPEHSLPPTASVEISGIVNRSGSRGLSWAGF